MSIDYTLFTFSCVPYSGEDWFTKAAQCAGLEYKSLHQAHPPFQARKTQDEIRVSLVRHPCDWLEQVYVAHQHGSLNGYAGRFGLLRTESFPLFIYHYLDMIPGEITQLWKQYEADVYQRYEDQPLALAELLESLDVPTCFVELVKQVPKAGPVFRNPVWDKSLRRLVMETESELCEHFDYW